MAKPPLRKRFFRGALVSVAILGTMVAMLWALQRQLTYFPDASPVPPAAEVIPDARRRHAARPQTVSSSARGSSRRPDGEANGMAVLFAPGNGGNRGGRATFAESLSRRGFAVLLMEYRGYGGNPGSPSEAGLAADAKAAAQALEELWLPSDPHPLLRRVLGHRCGVRAAGGPTTGGSHHAVPVHEPG